MHSFAFGPAFLGHFIIVLVSGIRLFFIKARQKIIKQGEWP